MLKMQELALLKLTQSTHLTATTKDSLEIQNWCEALGRKGKEFPYINSLKSMVGHCLSGAGSIESVATVLQLYHGFIFSDNCNDLNPEILRLIDASQIPQQVLEKNSNRSQSQFWFWRCKCVILRNILHQLFDN
jgi:3-oxoacyl-(acyl-carrier-protein) synthase